MNPCELTASVTALANALACRLSNDELSLLGAVLTQLGDTLTTIWCKGIFAAAGNRNRGGLNRPENG